MSEGPLVLPESRSLTAPQAASRVDCRIDFGIVVDPRASAEPIPINGVRPRDLNWERNPPSVADTFSFSTHASVVPVDFDVVKGIVFDGWLFCHGEPSRCQKGDPGYFSGYVDNFAVTRVADALTFAARDWTALPLSRKLTAEQVASIDWRASRRLWEVVDVLISFMPGGESWRVVSLDDSGDRDVVGVLGATRIGSAAEGIRAGDVLGGGDTTVWDAICRVCALMGAIPEVASGANGKRQVLLVSAGAYHAGDGAFDTFGRGGRATRTLTVNHRGEIDRVHKSLTADEALPDFVEVTAVKSGTGEVMRVRWPEYTVEQIKDGKLTGSLQDVTGVTSEAHALGLAKVAFSALHRGSLGVEVSTSLPWSDGGGVDAPDLLSMRPSAALQLVFANFEETGADPLELMVARGIPRGSAERLIAASRLTDTSLRLQARTIKHSWSPKEYTFSASMRRFLA